MPKKTKQKPGRKPNPRAVRNVTPIKVHVPGDDKARYQAAAESVGKSASAVGAELFERFAVEHGF